MTEYAHFHFKGGQACEAKSQSSRFFKFFGLGATETTLLTSAATVPAPVGTDADKLPTFEMGPLKINKSKETASVCAFCEVGCGLIVYSDKLSILYRFRRGGSSRSIF